MSTSLELVDYTQDIRSWPLPEQQHGAQQLDTSRPKAGEKKRRKRQRHAAACSALNG